MPATAIFLTEGEYNKIMERLSALEVENSNKNFEILQLNQRAQSMESTLSAYAKTMAELPRVTPTQK